MGQVFDWVAEGSTDDDADDVFRREPMTAQPMSSDLPAYSDFVSPQALAQEQAPPRRRTWWFRVVAVIGAALIVVPLVLGMFLRAAQGQQLLSSVGPYLTAGELTTLRADLATVAQARTDVLALRADHTEPAGSYPYVDALVREYPAIDTDMTGMIDTMSAQTGNYRKLADLPPFGAFPWLFALAGAVLVPAGVFGSRRAESGRAAPFAVGCVAVVAAGLVAAPFALQLFDRTPAASPLIQNLGPLMTHERVRTVQGYFITLVAGEGELNSRYVKAIPPGAGRAGIDAFDARWQPMTERFAGLIGTMNDNIDNFRGVVALDNSTKPLGFHAFRWFGWFFLVPGVIVAAVAAVGLRPRAGAAR